MFWRQERTLPCEKLMNNSLVIQPIALSSCKASSCPTSTEASQITLRMNVESGFTSTMNSSIPSVKSHLMEFGVNIFHLPAGLTFEWSVWSFLFLSVSLNYKAYNFLKSLHSTCPANPHLLILVTFPSVVPNLLSLAYSLAAYFHKLYPSY